MFNFPESLHFEITEPIDNFVNWLMTHMGNFFDAISRFILSIFTGVEWFLGIIPWWLLVIALFVAGWRLYNMWRGLVLAAMLFVIGLFGLWELMIYTLAIVIISVIITVIVGLPLGILMAKSQTLKKILMPILDGMQTLPSFVYLIPAIMLFGFGKVPAVFATTIYAVPPLIRLTYLGISNIKKDIIEAGLSFGSTSRQMLVKIQFPQALSTIMTGVNQTMMMAMAMVVISSMIGAEGIGEEVLISIRRLEVGRGFQAGISIVFLAIIMDRVLQGIADKLKGSE
jgi:glycine betaine/proline transport system permease protein